MSDVTFFLFNDFQLDRPSTAESGRKTPRSEASCLAFGEYAGVASPHRSNASVVYVPMIVARFLVWYQVQALWR